jgi:hypothetical protein
MLFGPVATRLKIIIRRWLQERQGPVKDVIQIPPVEKGSKIFTIPFLQGLGLRYRILKRQNWRVIFLPSEPENPFCQLEYIHERNFLVKSKM